MKKSENRNNIADKFEETSLAILWEIEYLLSGSFRRKPMSIKFTDLTLNSVVLDDKGGVIKLSTSDSAEITIRVVDPKDLNGLEFGTALDLALTEVVPTTVVTATVPVTSVGSDVSGTSAETQNAVASGGMVDSSTTSFPSTGSVSS